MEFDVPQRRVVEAGITRRRILVGGVAIAGGIAGVIADRTAALSGLLPVPLAGGSQRGWGGVNLRAVKPYDWLTRPLVGLGGRQNAAGYRAPFEWQFLYVGDDPGHLRALDVQVIAVATPMDDAPLTDVTLTSDPPVIVERLRDVGRPEDVAQTVGANGVPTKVGDLWVLIPRDAPLSAGAYRVEAQSRSGTWAVSFALE